MRPVNFCFIWPSGFKSYRWPFIDATYQVSVHLAKRFQKRTSLEIDQSETRIANGGHDMYGSGRN